MAENMSSAVTKNSPIEQVRLTVPVTDDCSLPALTFRAWILGVTFCILLSFISQFTFYRKTPISVPIVAVQILLLPLGKLMAAKLSAKIVRIPWTTWTFSINPGPFNIKEHIICCMFASAGANDPFAIYTLTTAKEYFNITINPLLIILLALSSQMIGYGFAGMFVKVFVNQSIMWWPEVLPLVTFFRALHEKEERKKGQLTQLQSLFLVFTVSFAYFIVPSYFFPSIASISFICLIWKHSVIMQQLGSGLNGYGIGSFALDWRTSSFDGSPLQIPLDAMLNKFVGFLLSLYVVVPVAYWTNSFDARKFPLFSLDAFDSYGNQYNVSRIMDDETFTINQKAYDDYSKLYLSIGYAYSYGIEFAVLTATISHAIIFHGRSIWQLVQNTLQKENEDDIHVQMMKKYEPIPKWWFCAILISMVGLAIVSSNELNKMLQLSYWGVLMACFLSLVSLLPFSLLQATSGQSGSIHSITKMIVGYMYTGKPLASETFRYYAMSSFHNGIGFLSSFKLGLYMKIPPKEMFICQVVGNIIACCSRITKWWIFSSLKNICQPELLPKGSPWTCTANRKVYLSMVIWDVVGSSRIFYPHGFYTKILLSFLIGAILPIFVWVLIIAFPNHKWLKNINVPLMLTGVASMPPVASVNRWSWFLIGFIFNYYVFKRFKGWWKKYTYLLSIGLDAGTSLMALSTTVVLNLQNIYGVSWWGVDTSDHCPLAICPTAPGIEVDGCPVF